jgi:RimJ/RimL family protein N-acetyltransferase
METALGKSTIKTERLELRHFRAEDAVALHPIFADPEAMRFWSSAPKSLAETEEFVRETIRAQQAGTGDGNCERGRSRDYEPCFGAWRYLDYRGRGPTERAVPSAT